MHVGGQIEEIAFLAVAKTRSGKHFIFRGAQKQDFDKQCLWFY